MATYTTNYNLDKYEGTDSPNLTDQYNSAMDKIDAQMMTNAQSAQTAQTAAGNAQTTAQAAQTAAATAQSAATAASTAAGEAQTAATNAQSAADDAASQAATKAPISHASSALTYGGGTSANYGHVKLVDTTAGGEGAANSVAATPAAVNAALSAQVISQGNVTGITGYRYTLTKAGNVCVFSLVKTTATDVFQVSIPAGNTNVYLIPEQYRPSGTFYMSQFIDIQDGSKTASLIIDATGQARINNFAGSTITTGLTAQIVWTLVDVTE